MRLDRILIPTDFSETANHAEAQAIALARRHHSQVLFFHAGEPYGEPPPHMMPAARDYLEQLELEADTTLSARVDALRASGINVSYTTSQNVPPTTGIVEAVKKHEPDLVVIGTHGRRGFQRFVLGSVAEKLLRTLRINVLSLSTEAPLIGADRSYARILVPIDFSDHSRRALDAAFALLADDGVLHAIHVVHAPIHPSFYPGGFAPAAVGPPMTGLVEEQLKQWLDGRRAECIVRVGDPFHQIMEARDETDAELIVMGTRGLTGLEHALIGSVAERVVRRSPVAVLTTHA